MKSLILMRRCLPALFLASATLAGAAPLPVQPDPAAITPEVATPSAPPLAQPSKLTNAVVKIFSTSREPDPFRPWTKQAPRDMTGSGVVIEGNRILTNAHVVSYASQVQIQAHQAGQKFSATVVAIAPGIDLAVLKLEDESFFRTHAPLPRAKKLPRIQDAVLAYGFPAGGSSLSITKGIVSRIEYATFNPPVSGLRIQIDAAINPGNSGGPAVVDEQMIGLAFSRLNNAQNIGYIIPNEEIDLFLKDIRDGAYHGKPDLLDDLQTLDNPALSAFLKLDKNVNGIIVHQPYGKDAAYPLKKWDVITHVAGMPVDDQGMIEADADLRLNLRYGVQKAAKNERVALTVVRAGQKLPVDLPLVTERPMLIPSLNGEYPSYFIYGPLVFSRASAQFISVLGGNANMMAAFSAVRSPLVMRSGDPPDAELEELVVVSSPFFPHRLAQGYSNPSFRVIGAVNGTPIRSLKHLVAVLRDLKDEFVMFEADNRGGETFVFKHQEMLAAVEDILSDNSVRAQGSPDVMEVWRGKGPHLAVHSKL